MGLLTTVSWAVKGARWMVLEAARSLSVHFLSGDTLLMSLRDFWGDEKGLGSDLRSRDCWFGENERGTDFASVGTCSVFGGCGSCGVGWGGGC